MKDKQILQLIEHIAAGAYGGGKETIKQDKALKTIYAAAHGFDEENSCYMVHGDLREDTLKLYNEVKNDL